MTDLRQILALCIAHLRIWWRRPIEAFVCACMAAGFLLIANQVFTVIIGRNVRVAYRAPDAGIEQELTIELASLDVQAIPCGSTEDGARAVASGAASAFVDIEGTDPVSVSLHLSGRNVLLDRELSGLLLRSASRILQRKFSTVRFAMHNDRCTPEAMTVFMTAGMVAFFLLTLAQTTCGSFWVREWESGTLFTFLATPARRYTLVAGRALAGVILSLATFAVAVFACRLIVPWPLPGRIGQWLAVVTVQTLAANGIFFALASICRRYRFYINVASFLVVVLMFVSGTFSPVEIMPPWERAAAHLTPTFYAVRSMRAAMLGAEPVAASDLLVLLAWAAGTHIFGYFRLASSTMKQ